MRNIASVGFIKLPLRFFCRSWASWWIWWLLTTLVHQNLNRSYIFVGAIHLIMKDIRHILCSVKILLWHKAWNSSWNHIPHNIFVWISRSKAVLKSIVNHRPIPFHFWRHAHCWIINIDWSLLIYSKLLLSWNQSCSRRHFHFVIVSFINI